MYPPQPPQTQSQGCRTGTSARDRPLLRRIGTGASKYSTSWEYGHLDLSLTKSQCNAHASLSREPAPGRYGQSPPCRSERICAHNALRLGDRPGVEKDKLIVQAPVVGPGFLLTAGRFEDKAEDLPADFFNCGIASCYAAGVDVDEIVPARSESAVGG